MNKRLRRLLIRIPLVEELITKSERKLFDRQHDFEIAQAKKNGDETRVGQLKWEYNQYWAEVSLEQYIEETDEIIKKAHKRGVQIPIKPKAVGGGDPDQNDDWESNGLGEWWLTNNGRAKVREKLREEEKWRREARAHWFQWISALTGLIGTIIGLLAFLKK